MNKTIDPTFFIFDVGNCSDLVYFINDGLGHEEELLDCIDKLSITVAMKTNKSRMKTTKYCMCNLKVKCGTKAVAVKKKII